MIELIGGPFDGRTQNRNPETAEVFVGESGALHKERQSGDLRYVEEGVCQGCGVRAAPGEPKHRRFVLEQMSKGECALCGQPVA